MGSQLEEINRHIEELAGRLPVGNRDRLLEDAMAIRAIMVGSESKHHSELSAAYGMATRKQEEIEQLEARLAEAERDAARYRFLRERFRISHRDKDAYHTWVTLDPTMFRGPSIDAICDRELESGKKYVAHPADSAEASPTLGQGLGVEGVARAEAVPSESNHWRGALTSARQGCPLCGRTDAHTHTSGPMGMS